MSRRQQIIQAGFRVIGATRLHRLVAPLTQGLGAILTFHHVRPERDKGFAPNGLLEITPGFLDAMLGHLRRSGTPVVSLDDAVVRLRSRRSGSPFVVLTFDDGYRDNREWALPILERHSAPATFFITTGFVERTARLWWQELEEVVRRTSRISVDIQGERLDLDCATPSAKTQAFEALYWHLRRGPEELLLETIGELCAEHAVDSRAMVEGECLDWAGIESLARHPLVTIGAHTLNHPMLAKHREDRVRAEIADSRAILEARLLRPIRHLSYPVGDPTSAGAREFAIARDLGFASAVTTRPGLLFGGHAEHLTALPRVSVNGNYQTLDSLDILLSGAALALWNRGRRVDAA